MSDDDTDTGTINHDNERVRDVAAALADASHAGGLSKAYYRAADDALGELAAELQGLRQQVERLTADNIEMAKGRTALKMEIAAAHLAIGDAVPRIDETSLGNDETDAISLPERVRMLRAQLTAVPDDDLVSRLSVANVFATTPGLSDAEVERLTRDIEFAHGTLEAEQRLHDDARAEVERLTAEVGQLTSQLAVAIDCAEVARGVAGDCLSIASKPSERDAALPECVRRLRSLSDSLATTIGELRQSESALLSSTTGILCDCLEWLATTPNPSAVVVAHTTTTRSASGSRSNHATDVGSQAHGRRRSPAQPSSPPATSTLPARRFGGCTAVTR